MAGVDDAPSAYLQMGKSKRNRIIPCGFHDLVGMRRSLCSWCECNGEKLLDLTLNDSQCLALIGQVLRRRFEKPSVEKLRQDTMQTEDSTSTARTLSEQIEKRGAQSWIDPLIEDMGEWLLLQLGDTANLLEVLLK